MKLTHFLYLMKLPINSTESSTGPEFGGLGAQAFTLVESLYSMGGMSPDTFLC